MKIAFAPFAEPGAGAYVLAATEGGRLVDAAPKPGGPLADAIARALAASRFQGKPGQVLDVIAPAGVLASRIVLVGLGAADKVDAQALENAAASAYGALAKTGDQQAAIAIAAPKGSKIGAAEAAARVAFGIRLASYRFDHYRTKLKPEDKPALTRVTVMGAPAPAAKKAFAPLDALADGVSFARDLVSEPANTLTPPAYAKRLKALAGDGLEVEVLGEKAMKKLGMGALLGVGQGSVQESQLVILKWNGGRKSDAPVALVGKGVCFDSGGISLKPGAGMWDMKWDMGGSAAVAGAMLALARRKAKVNAVGVVGLVENMPDGKAQRPGDIVTSMSGQTIEVWNTDAEGRLVLADALWYTKETFKPKVMVDLATLTGAIMIALGSEYAGLFANDDTLAETLTKAGAAEGEKLWRMPMADSYDRQIDSRIADMKNITGGRDAGSSVGAVFLRRFVGETKWAHLDIAGVTWSDKGRASAPAGATGFGVRLLDRWIASTYE